MKEAENEDGEGKRKVESLWPRIHRMPFFILKYNIFILNISISGNFSGFFFESIKSQFSKFIINGHDTSLIYSINEEQFL